MKWPPKREGACSNAPTQKLTGLPQSNSGVAIAQHVCRHGTTRVELMPQGHMHHARVICALCGRFLRWLPRPETIERERVNAFKLAKLAMCEGLSKWERSFVHHVSQQRKLSPKQQALLVQLCTQYLEGKTP
jgi:hypothetical protein